MEVRVEMNDQQIASPIITFDHEVFGSLDIINVNGKEYFPATDVAIKLGYLKPHNAIDRHCKEMGITFQGVIDSLGRTQQKKFISEGNLYRLIARSKLNEAEKFESWVFDEVLPAIRKTGGYVSNDELFVNTYLSEADEQTKSLFKTTLQTMKKQNDEVTALKPKALFADAVVSSESSILVGELAKLIQQNGIQIGQNRLFKWLRKHGFLVKQGDSYNLPTQKSMNLELFEIKKGTFKNPDGSIRTTSTAKVTGKGQVYFVNKFLQASETDKFNSDLVGKQS